jgi:hypothetical protein
MNSIPVDLTRLTGLVCVSAPEAKTNPDGEVRADREIRPTSKEAHVG